MSPVLDVWCAEATDMLYDYCYEPGTDDYFRTLYAVVHAKETKGSLGGEKFKISLLDNFSGRTISIGNLMIECGFANCVEEEKMHEFPIIENDFLSNSEDEVDERAVEVVEPTALNEEDEFWNNLESEFFNPLELLSGKDIYVTERLSKRKPKIKEIEQKPLKALPLSEFRTPTVVWYQTDIHIKLNIQVPNVTDYIAKLLRDRVFVFRTNENETPYHLSLQLYGKVEKTFIHSAGGLSVKVTLSKCRKEEWPRLTILKDLKNIKYNMDMYQDADAAENSDRKFLTIDEEHKNERWIDDDEGKELCFGSDFDENSDSDMLSSD